MLLESTRLNLLALILATTCALSAERASAAFEECAPPPSGPVTLTVGAVACQLIESPSVGGQIPFSYYVPPGCRPSLGVQCPVLYLLHGFGGSYTSLLSPTNLFYVKSLTSGPPVDPNKVLDPWSYADPSTWEAKPAIDMILIAPHGRTVPGGFGPEEGLDSFWMDWNPRYASGGDLEKYATAPPRFETYLVHELIPFVENNFPTGKGREWHALDGESLGGYGSYKNGLQHPDVFSSIGSISGALNILFVPGIDRPASASPIGISPPVDLGYHPLTGPGSFVPFNDIPEAAKGFAVALIALGDPVGDQAFFRGNMPRDLAMNGRPHTGNSQTLHIRGCGTTRFPAAPRT